MKNLEEYQQPASIADFLAEICVDPVLGLSRDDAMKRRSLYGANRVTPPVKCPTWVCCLLPCLMRTASMKLYQKVLPREVIVRRQVIRHGQTSSRRMRMDVTSLVYGDVVEVKAGDVAGADLRVIECSDDCWIDQTTLVCDKNEDEEEAEQGINRKYVKTETPPLHLQQDILRCSNIIPMTATVLQGSAVAVVLSTGNHTLWGQLVSHHEWPRVPGTLLQRKKRNLNEENTSLIV
ncbi:magnesium-transporting atpase [Plasmopara halstedii]|uniref:Magnesium-transporting atpase n=1 Tax=Plasmopara halstedii TaxID=4781 RepID=A0A0P1AGY7_PLAHL|nr:magnesium-transporting atpase [Plasmopara halstedii]CEG40160.1 magnesium-transporting atpase [Plasmopara halstedii]|eukprot:XP_024576529.1 magnesium-transporting atpase [Plasmopara halstedii]